MPIYEYKCLKCEQEFEIFTFLKDEKPLCPNCGSEEVKKKVSNFQGSGGSCKITPSGFS
ncbi:MAG: zinc ribbon domain-containing protein [Thermoanaerobaculia bacterium]